MIPVLSVIIPTLNEADCIGVTLDRLARLRMEHEVIVVDGGSRDDTCGIAQWCHAKVLFSERGRGTRMRAGAAAATAGILWFLRADTLVPADAGEYILDALADNQVAGGNFRLAFDDGGLGLSASTYLYRLSWLGLRLGDLSLFVRRSVYEEVGGFAPYLLFEDLDLIRRIRSKGRFVTVPCTLHVACRR
jgi:glycosyltransferase involved in cell wall biosynthesis